MDHLVRFYLQTRPIGWWGPVRAEARRRGLLSERPSPTEPRPLIKRTWTPEEADAWSREDWIAIVLSPMVMALAMVGGANLFLGRQSGIWQLVTAVAVGAFMFWVIDPKLRAVSVEYELQQAGYLRRLERQMRWRSDGPDPDREDG